jgi:hypothetical protein
MANTVLKRTAPKSDPYDVIELVSSDPQPVTEHDLYEGTSKTTDQYACRSATEFAPVVNIAVDVLEADYEVVSEGDDEPEPWDTVHVNTGSAVDRGLSALLRHALIDNDEEDDAGL